MIYLLARYHVTHEGCRVLLVTREQPRPLSFQHILRARQPFPEQIDTQFRFANLKPITSIISWQPWGARDEVLEYITHRYTLRMLAITFSILMVEMVLLVNKVGNVNSLGSTGQLVAFIVSVGGCLTLAMQVGVEIPRKKVFNCPLFEPPIVED